MKSIISINYFINNCNDNLQAREGSLCSYPTNVELGSKGWDHTITNNMHYPEKECIIS